MLRDECTARGVSTVSELARTAVRCLASNASAGSTHSLADDVRDLQDRLRVLAADLERVARQVEAEKASAQGGGGS